MGPAGKVVCVDVQADMLERLGKRLAKRGLRDRVELRKCGTEDLGLDDVKGSFDLALALHVVHETPSPANTIRSLAASLNKDGQLLLIEPPGHCSRDLGSAEGSAAEQSGLVREPHPMAEGRRMLALWRKRG